MTIQGLAQVLKLKMSGMYTVYFSFIVHTFFNGYNCLC